MFSLIDVMLDEPMKDVVDKLKLSSDVSAALLEKEGKLAQLIDITIAYEQGDWSYIEKLSSTLSLEIDSVTAGYKCALNWCDEQMSFIL
jgi:EAL and modified HD-GYP domain-containing signal transduction protein